MNAVDNYEKIRKLLVFDSKDDFYQIQIIKRRKENPGLKNNAKVVKEYYVNSLAYYDEIHSDVLGITEATRSRAYINLNVRSFKNAAFATMDRILKHMRSEDYFSVRQAYTRSASSRTSRKNMRWIIDFDKDDIDTDTMFCLKKGNFTHELMISGVEILDIVPTPNGLHYIVKPFDRLKFKEAYLNHQSSNIKKNSPTVLFSTVL